MRKFSPIVAVYKLTTKDAEMQSKYPNLVQTNHVHIVNVYFPSTVKDTFSFERWLHVSGFEPNGLYRIGRLRIKKGHGACYGPSAKFQLQDYKVVWVQPKSWLHVLLKKGDREKAKSVNWATQQAEIS